MDGTGKDDRAEAPPGSTWKDDARRPNVTRSRSVVREAATRSGQVGDATWQRAKECGWSSEQLAEAFAFLALTVFTAYFLNYAQTPMDLLAGPE
jgi:hypothetical protein